MSQTRREFFRYATIGTAPMGSVISSLAKPWLPHEPKPRTKVPVRATKHSPIFQLEQGEQHVVTIRVVGIEGHIEFYLESINVASPGFRPSGVETVVIDPKATVLLPGRERLLQLPNQTKKPLVLIRGPETQLKLNRADEYTEWKRPSENVLELIVTKPNVFRYEARIESVGDEVKVEAELANKSSWDWRDAYVYFHWGLGQCPTFADYSGDRTVLFTSKGTRRVSELGRRVWHSPQNAELYDVEPCNSGDDHCFLFRPTAQYYEPEGRSLPRAEDGFDYGMCGISPDHVVAGLSLRQAKEGDRVLAVSSRRFRAIFVDLSNRPKGSQCIHVDPSAGDLLVGEVAVLRGALFLLRGTLEEVAREAARRLGLPQQALLGRS